MAILASVLLTIGGIGATAGFVLAMVGFSGVLTERGHVPVGRLLVNWMGALRELPPAARRHVTRVLLGFALFFLSIPCVALGSFLRERAAQLA